jgi:polyphosphate kinase 2 (PPK2 family)
VLDAQFEKLRENGKFPVVILISGVDGRTGKGETINVLYEWMDPRFMSTLAFTRPPTKSGAPVMWRYWRALPPKGRVGIFAGSWYSNPIAERIAASMTRAISTSAWTRSTASRPCWSMKARWCSSSGSTCPRMARSAALKALEGSA